MSGPANGNKNAGKKPVNLSVDPKPGSSRPESSNQAVPGLSELLSVIEAIAATPIGRHPVIEDAVINKLKPTPLYSAYVALQPVMMKILVSETTVEARSPWKMAHETREDIPQLKALEAEIGAVSNTVDRINKSVAKSEEVNSGFRILAEKDDAGRIAMVEAVTTSAANTRGCVETLREEVGSFRGRIESEIGNLTQGIERLQKNLVEDANERIRGLQARVTELETQNENLKHVVELTSSTLSPLEALLRTAIRGEFNDPSGSEANSAGQEADQTRKQVDVTALARSVTQKGFRLVSQCEGLLSVIFPDSGSQIQELKSEFDGRWLEAMETVSDLRSEIRAMAERNARRTQRLQFFQFIIDQVRLGRYFPSQWAEALQGQDAEEFMSRPFNGFTSIQALAADIYKLRKSYKHLRKHLQAPPGRGQASGRGWAPLGTL